MPAVATAGGLPTRLGKYEIVTPLAAGGMARIYIARTTGIGSFERHVVLKLITPERANDATAVQMFLDEARLAAALNHQNVAQVFEVGEDASIHYLAMEYVHGQDLRALLAKAGSQGTRVPLELALTVVAGAAAGLNHAHERRGSDGVPLGIVHRDVSPSNIMIGLDGAVKLLDFGIAKATMRSIETVSGIIKGKFAYMSPEQCRGRDVDRRSDVFSLGIILYEISTQHRCFRADSDFDTMHRIVTGDVVRPTRLVQGYPQALEAIVMKALAVDSNQRYQSAGALLEAIESFAVSARMSLSTMALGRFMRDMFGELPEPWLVAGRNSQPLQPKESTISNTHGTGEPLPPAGEPARTLLDMQRGEQAEPVSRGDDWNARSYPQAQPSYASAQTLPPTAGVQREQTPVPATPPAGSIPPQIKQAFASTPVSGSGPSHPALPVPGMPIVSTRHGYASAPGVSASDLSYPRYLAPADEEEVALKPNRRPLFIGLGIVVVGLAVLLIISLTKTDTVKPIDTSSGGDPGSGSETPVEVPLVATGSGGGSGSALVTPGSGSQIAVGSGNDETDESISIKVVSEPAGADVLLAGKPIGTTPLDIKYPRESKQVILVVHRASYVDVETRIDLSGDFSKEVTLQKVEVPTGKNEGKVEESKTGTGTKTGTGKTNTGTKTGASGPKTGTGTPKTGTGTGSATKPNTGTGTGSGSATKPNTGTGAKKNCQPADNVQPWDTRPVCK